VDIPAAVPVSPKSRRFSTILFVLLVIVITALPFLSALRYGFVYDDDVQVVGTVATRAAQSPADYYLTSVWTPRNSAIPVNFNYYRPLFYSWLHINGALFGLRAFPWHLSALAIHLAVTVLVFLLLRRHLQNSWMALTGSLVFGLHPVHIESVVWISGATDPLAALGVLGSFLLWLQKIEKRSAGLLVGSLACYAAALLSKETAVALPAIVFTYVLIGLPDSERTSPAIGSRMKSALRETLPFLGVTLLYFGVRLAVLHSFRAGASPWLSRSDVLLTAPSVLLFYLLHLVWPAGLRLFYDFALVVSVGSARFWVPLILLAAAAGGILAGWRRIGKVVPAAAAWIAIPLLPVLNIGLFFKDDFLHDRYLYLPCVGLALLCGVTAQQMLGEKPEPMRRLGVLSGLVLLLSFLATSTVVELAPWRDNLSLYAHAAENSTNTMARVNLASEDALRGRYETARAILEGVIQERPDFWLVNYNLGYVDYRLKRLDEAERLLRRATEINPGDADAHEYLGLVFLRENRVDEAASQLSAAIARNSQGQGYHFALGMVLKQQGHLDAAKAEFDQEIMNHPGNALIRAQVSALEHDSASSDRTAAATSPQ
jgi:tetratricopeptide (TPR) repeat protein